MLEGGKLWSRPVLQVDHADKRLFLVGGLHPRSRIMAGVGFNARLGSRSDITINRKTTQRLRRTMYSRNKTYAGLAILTIVVLAGSLAYYYSTASAQISSLKSDGRSLCATVGSAFSSVIGVFTNTTLTMQQQIREDNSIIVSLNATRPAGYANMTATLQDQVRKDTGVINSINNLITVDSSLSGLSGGPCSPFN